MTRRGCFITLEGVDGAGKSTHVGWLAHTLREQGQEVVVTREPGGTPVGEKLRDLLLTESMELETETLLMFAGRCELVRTVIVPALRRGAWVVCDRFTDATYAYQGGGRELGAQQVAVLEQWVHPHLQPDLTFLFDVPVDVARQRLADGRDLDRFEREGAAFFERTRSAYYARVSEHPHRFRLIDSTVAVETVRAQLLAALQVLLASQRTP